MSVCVSSFIGALCVKKGREGIDLNEVNVPILPLGRQALRALALLKRGDPFISCVHAFEEALV
jgi:hypothetical protein